MSTDHYDRIENALRSVVPCAGSNDYVLDEIDRALDSLAALRALASPATPPPPLAAPSPAALRGLQQLAEEECENGIEACGETCAAAADDPDNVWGEPGHSENPFEHWCGPCIAKQLLKDAHAPSQTTDAAADSSGLGGHGETRPALALPSLPEPDAPAPDAVRLAEEALARVETELHFDMPPSLEECVRAALAALRTPAQPQPTARRATIRLFDIKEPDAWIELLTDLGLRSADGETEDPRVELHFEFSEYANLEVEIDSDLKIVGGRVLSLKEAR